MASLGTWDEANRTCRPTSPKLLDLYDGTVGPNEAAEKKDRPSVGLGDHRSSEGPGRERAPSKGAPATRRPTCIIDIQRMVTNTHEITGSAEAKNAPPARARFASLATKLATTRI